MELIRLSKDSWEIEIDLGTSKQTVKLSFMEEAEAHKVFYLFFARFQGIE